MPQVPVTILNGFLGAGKTTLLQSLVVQACSMQSVRARRHRQRDERA